MPQGSGLHINPIAGQGTPGCQLGLFLRSIYFSPGGTMTTQEFFEELDARIANYDLLCHPFYKTWAAGGLSREDLQAYGREYFHHVEAFPSYLTEFAAHLPEDGLRKAVLANRDDEMGAPTGRSHAELWLDFVEGMGGRRTSEDTPNLPDLSRD